MTEADKIKITMNISFIQNTIPAFQIGGGYNSLIVASSFKMVTSLPEMEGFLHAIKGRII